MSKKRQAIKTKIHEFWNYIKVAFNIKTHIRNWICKPERTSVGVDRLYLRAYDSPILITSGTGSSRTKNNNDKF